MDSNYIWSAMTKGELLNFVITLGNVDDRGPLASSNLLKEVMGKLFTDNS